MTRSRVDALLVTQGYFSTQSQAASAVLAGEVYFDDAAHRRVEKPGQQVLLSTRFDVKIPKKYVSRGGLKLKGALRAFGYDMSEKNVLDAGASTGGFTDCALQEGARRVSAVDVGYGQLAWKLQIDDRVSVFDRLNIKDASADVIGGPFDVIVADLSFIPLRSVIGTFTRLARSGGDFLLLIKPQFEAQRAEIGERGVVGDSEVHARVVRAVVDEFVHSGVTLEGLTYSPIKGPEGNIEFWLYGRNEPPACPRSDEELDTLVSDVVSQANAALG